MSLYTDDFRTETMADRRERRLARQRQQRRIWEEGHRVELTVGDLRRGEWLLEVPAQFNRRRVHLGGKITRLVNGYWGVEIHVEGGTLPVRFPMHFTCIVMRERSTVAPDVALSCLVCFGTGVIKPCSHPKGDDDPVCDCPFVMCPVPDCAHR